MAVPHAGLIEDIEDMERDDNKHWYEPEDALRTILLRQIRTADHRRGGWRALRTVTATSSDDPHRDQNRDLEDPAPDWDQ